MAALTPTISTLLTGVSPRILKVKQAAQNDYITLGYKGVFQLAGRLMSGAAAAITRATIAVNNTGTAYTATSTTIAYDTATNNRSTGSFYLETASGEIIEVIDPTPTAASGTLTVLKRGALGTTPSATGLANEAVLYIANVLVLGDNQTGAVTMSFIEMPEDGLMSFFQ